MPTTTVLWLVVGAALFANLSFIEVVRSLGLTAPSRRGSRQVPPSSSSVAEARQRLAWEDTAAVFRASAAAWSNEVDALGRYRGLSVFAADGVIFDTPDTDSNVDFFGRPSSTVGERAAFPQARAVVLLNVLTRLAVDAEIGPYLRSELSMFAEIVPRVPNHSLTILDRNFRSFGLLFQLNSSGEERHWLLRARTDLNFTVVRTLSDGDEVVTVAPGWAVRQKDPSIPRTVTARLIRVQSGQTPLWLLTSLVDSTRYPANEIVKLYGQRWEIEMAFDDMKTEQRGAATTLRSKRPDGVRQEMFGLLIAYNLVRIEMAHAAQTAGATPDRLSFHRTLTIVKHYLLLLGTSSAPSKAMDRVVEMRDTLAFLMLPERRPRSYPRALKQIIPKYPRKKIGKPMEVH